MHLRPAAVKLAGAAALTTTVVASVLASAPSGATKTLASRAAVRLTAAIRSRPHAQGPAALLARGGGKGATAAPGVLAGTLTGPGGRPVFGACVIATGRYGSAMAMTRPDGHYVLSGLRSGGYRLHVIQCAAPARYFDPAGQSSVSATVSVAIGQVSAAPGLRLTVAPALGQRPAIPAMTPTSGLPSGVTVGSALVTGRGAISGKVTGNGNPLKGVCVFAFGPGYREAKTNSTGHYHIGRLKAGRYFVRFLPYCINRNTNWLPQWYKGINGFFIFKKRPTTVHVTAGHTTTGINAALLLGGQLGGIVRNKSGLALRGICVEALVTGKHKFPFFFFGGFAATGRNGHYVMHALFPASYKVLFNRQCGNRGNYGLIWWRNSATEANANAIKITTGRVLRHVNATMPRGATVSGVVRASATGQPLGGICIYAEPTTQNGQFAFTRTPSTGKYKLIALTAGRYRVFFVKCRNRDNVLPQTRSLVVRKTGQNITRFNAFLQPGAIISGTVTDTHGAPVGGICVQVSGRGFGGTITGADGTYSINALPGGNYTVQFSPGCGSSGSYAPQFYKGQTNPASADQVPLIQGQTTAGINATLQPGGTITGTVTDTSGNKLNKICVSLSTLAQSQFPFFYGNYIEFTKNGAYTAENLTPGLYSVNFNCFGNSKLATQWFMSKPDSGNADLVSAPAGVVTTGISAALPAPGSISGTVTNHWGKPVANVCVLAIPAGSPYPQLFFGFSNGYTGRKGGYTISRLAPGSYNLQFRDCNGGRYGSQWYGDKPTEQSSVPVTVTSGQVSTGINATMRLGGSISGQITSSGHLSFSCAEAEDLTTESFGFAYSRNGSYTIKGLSSGSYEVILYDCGYPRQFGIVTRQVTLTAPKAVTGVNARLTLAGSIAGTVTAASSGRPLAGVCVAVDPVSAHAYYGEGVTDQNGRYTVTGLSAGTYKVFLGDEFCPFFFGFGPFSVTDASNYAPQWYSGKPTEASATPVTVSSGNLVTGIDASLSADGGISGTVTDASSSPVAGECVTAVPVNPVPDPLFNTTLTDAIAVTASDGRYSVVDLPPGQYKVEFSTGCGSTGFKTQWWKNAASQQTATTITVPAAATATGINATLQH